MSCEAKLKELLHNLCSTEIKIYSEASKEFISVLRGVSGGHFLSQYMQASPLFSELMEAWKLQKGKPGMVHVVSLISVILDHPDGKYKLDDRGRITLSRRLDKFARSIIEIKLEDIYMELNSKESRRQNAALSLLAAVVRRGVGLASEVAKNFDFKLPVFSKLAEYQKKNAERKGKYTTRRSFIEFAMSFLEVGNPRLLRWVLQQKDMYSGILCGLGSDDDETVVYVLSVLRDRVLTSDSLVPPGLRSVLFGSITLDQLVSISGNPLGGPSSQIAHEVLVMVCTDPLNGLMPNLNVHANILKGNPRRLLELMKKLKASENDHHRDLLLAIVSGRPTFGSAYMEEFPYVLEPRASSTWTAAISLASNLVASTRTRSFGTLASQSDDPPSLDSSEVQCLLKCIMPNAFGRIVINRGLLHSDAIVKHGTLRFLLEALKSLDSLFDAIDCNSSSNDLMEKKWMFLKQEIQGEVRAFLPDPQVLLKLLSSFSCMGSRSRETSLKRPRKSEESPEIHSNHSVKKLKPDLMNEDIDILISGIGAELDSDLPKEMNKESGTVIMEDLGREDDHLNIITGIWGLRKCGVQNELKDAETIFHSKLLDALTLYLRAIPNAMDRSYDFFKLLPTKPLSISVHEQQSLLSLLIEYVGLSSPRRASVRPPELMFKHLPLLIGLLHSPVKSIQDQAYVLVRAAMLSAGGFDRNLLEIDAWLLFLPGYRRDKSSLEGQCVEVVEDCSPIVSFLCDAVSTMGNNLYKYLNELRCLSSNLKGIEDVSPNFSPLVICILRKCIRLLDSGSGTFKVYEKSMISIYVCSTLCFILQTQVRGGLLSSLIDSILTERIDNFSSVDDDIGELLCEWRPLKNLLLFSRSVFYQKDCSSLFSIVPTTSDAHGHSFARALLKIKKMIRKVGIGDLVGVASAFCFSTVCTTPDEILENFPSVITVSKCLFGDDLSFLSFMFFHERKLLAGVADLWPDIFLSGLELAMSVVSTKCKMDGPLLLPEIGTPHKELISCMDISNVESASLAFSLFLKQAPFHILFPAIMLRSKSSLLHSSKMVDFLRAKLSEGNESVASVRLILFWVHHLQSSFRVKPLGELEQLSEICFLLLKYMVSELLFVKSDFGSSKSIGATTMITHVIEVVETIFYHPAVILSVSRPLCCYEDLSCGSSRVSFEEFLRSSEEGIHPTDNIVLLLATVTESMLTLSNGLTSVPETEVAVNKLIKAFKSIIEQVVSTFKCKFEMCISTKDPTLLFPIFCIFRVFVHFISPFMLLELVNWIFGKVEENDSTDFESFKAFGFSIGCYISEVAFELMSTHLNYQNPKTVTFFLFWEMEGRSTDISYLEKVYYKIIEIATCFKLESADLCLLKAVNVVRGQKTMQPQISVLPSFMAIFRVISSSPIEMLVHCINNIDATKAKLLFFLTEASPLHLTLFGKILTFILNKDFKMARKNCDHAPTDEELMMLLPVALSCLNSNFVKFGLQFLKHFESILSFYSRFLLDGFLNWKSFASRNIFWEEYGEHLPSAAHELLKVFSDSVLGKAICLLQYHFALNEDSARIETRMKLFECICPYSNEYDDLLDFDICKINMCFPKDSLNLINRVIAKISFCWMLLFPKENLVQHLPREPGEESKKLPQGVGVNRECSARMRFVNLLVSTLHKVVKGFPLVADDSEKLKNTDCSQIFRCLEVFILRNIVEFSNEMKNDLIHLSSIPFLEQFVKSSFLYRFEDPTTLRVLRTVLTLFSEGKFCCNVYFELLLEHSQFVPTILWSETNSDSAVLPHAGILLKPMSSILKSHDLLAAERSAENEMIACEIFPLYMRKLEVVKLLRALYRLRIRKSSLYPEEDAHANSRELVSLLLSCYGATMSEIDMEIFDLIREIMSTEGSNYVNIAEMDYFWGRTALKLRREKALEKTLSFNVLADGETAEEHRRRQFREYFALDYKLCIATILHFPYNRTAGNDDMFLRKISHDNVIDVLETPSRSIKRIQQYDPAFLLHFSIHVLSMGYLEMLEFAGLGLLGIAFVSISSPDEGIRKLGYEAIGRFKNALENGQNRKDGLRLRLLLTYLQNGITEPWQRIPSVVAIFSAEASFILLNPSNDHYATISKLLMRSPRVDLKSIPLFHNMFGSTSVNFKTERLWILRLTYAGLNSDVDAHIFMRKGLLEILLSFYSSSLSDYESKILILQIVKKSVKLPLLACYLVERCNLISWLSSILSFCSNKLCVYDKSPFITQMKVVLEVIDDVISLRNITEWLQKYALEQLSELSCIVLKIFAGNLKNIKQNVPVVTSLLNILVLPLRISQKRRLYQPHFTLSYEVLFQLCQAIDTGAKSGLHAELGLRAMLMSAPPAVISCMDKTQLSKFVTWGVCTALRSCSKGKVFLTQRESYYSNVLGEEQSEDSPVSKLLRWLTATVILGKILESFKPPFCRESLNVGSLQSLLENIEKRHVEAEEKIYDKSIRDDRNNNEALAALILYLQQLLGVECRVLPSVISALSLLLFSCASNDTGIVSLVGNQGMSVAKVCSKIRSPVEANPAWRWSYYKPWEDLSSTPTELEKMDEHHACQTLLVIFSNALGRKSLEMGLPILSHQELENSGVFEWESNILTNG